MKQRMWLSLVALAALALAGCGKSTSSLQAGGDTLVPAGSDQAQVESVVQNNPSYVDEDVWQSQQTDAFDGTSSGLAAIRPLRFWRNITSVDRTMDTQFGAPDSMGRPTEALVTVHKVFLGTFNIVAGSPDPSDTSRSLIRKPLDDLWTRKLALRRFALPGERLSRWHLVGTSGVEVHTHGGTTMVVSLHVQSEGVDTTITDPLQLQRLRRILLFQPGATVKVTVTTNAADDVVLFYRNDSRRRFTSNGDGTFTFSFVTGQFPGLRHFAVDALSHGTLFDDQAAYDSNAWVLPFAVDPARAPVETP